MDNPIRTRFASKADFFEKSMRYWNPHKTKFWQEAGVDLVIDRREGYFIYDWSGKRLINMHLNGGTYNLGHRNPELVQALVDATQWFDIGNHHFAALARTALAEDLAATTGGKLQYTIYGSGGGEAVDIALKTARHATKRKKIVSILKGYHGHTGLALGTADGRYSKPFLSDRPDEFIQVPFNDLGATSVTQRNTGSTDHIAFDAVGLPGFQFIQDAVEYDSRTHHSNQDVYDRIQADDMKQASIIMAALVYQAAMADEKLPRKPLD